MALSGVIYREDYNFTERIDDVNSRLRKNYSSLSMRFTDNSDINGFYLNREKLLK